MAHNCASATRCLNALCMAIAASHLTRRHPFRSAEWYKTALDCGINYMDTARAYAVDKAGDGVMVPDEITVGEAIKGRDRGSIVISTKTASRDAAGARADLETSLSNLGTDFVDIIHLHGMFTPEERETVRLLPPIISPLAAGS